MTETLSRLSGRAADKIWVQSYPAAVPAEIAPHAHQSLGALFEASCAKFADRLAFSSMGRSMTFRELEQQSRKVGAWLQSKGLVKGDRVAVMTPNILQNPVAVYGILRAGMIVVNVNPLYTPARTRASAQGFRRESDRRLGKLRPYGRAGGCAHRRQACRGLRHGRHAGVEGP